jgi:uncharacterized membrane protein
MAIGREIEDINRALIRHQHDHPPVRDLNKEADRKLSRAQRVGDDFARLLGSWTFVVLQSVLVLAWLVLNVLGFTNHWDQYPFQLLNLALSLEAAIWVSIVLMALNRIADRDRLRAQHDFEVDVKGEDEVKALMTHLEVQDEILIQVLHRLDHTDRELRRLGRRLGVEEAS